MSQSVQFPIPPYQVQRQISQLLYQSLEDSKKLCVIESPTGTGKSYAVLVGLASWIVDNKYRPKKIDEEAMKSLPSFIKPVPEDEYEIKQERKRIDQKMEKIIKNVISQNRVFPKITLKKQENIFEPDEEYLNLKKEEDPFFDRVSYYDLPKIVYTSRTHSQLSQIIESFRKLKTDLRSVSIASKRHLCINKAVKSSPNPEHECSRRLDTVGCPYYSKQSYAEFLNNDIEESVGVGSKHSKCPYYQLKSLLDVADVICVPYTSIMSKGVRDKLGIRINNAIVVFDQGHNVIENELQMRSIQLNLKDLMCLNDLLNDYLAKYPRLSTENGSYIRQITRAINGIKNAIALKHDQHMRQQKVVDDVGVNEFIRLLNIHQLIISQIRNFVESSHINHKIHNHKNQSNPQTLYKFLDFFEEMLVYSIQTTRVLFKIDEDIQKCSVKLMAFSVAKVTQIIEAARMTIIVGGTLSPLSSLEPLIQRFSGVYKSFDHVIDPKNCNLYIMDRFNNIPMLFTHEFKHQDSTLERVNQIIKGALAKTKQGVVVFVQSYKYLDFLKEYISKKSDFASICLFDSVSNLNVLNSYESKIKNGEQTILFSVMGGKLSQGINFSNELARVLIVLGLPYPDTRTGEMQLKIANNRQNYVIDMCMKLVNQTIGRAIRHAEDYASILLVDRRFVAEQDKLPKWMKRNVRVISSLEDMACT